MTDATKSGAPDHFTFTRHEEVLEPIVHPVDRGLLRIHRTTETVPSDVISDVAHDEVFVERIEIGQLVDTAPQPRQEGDTWIIPVIEEVLVVEKRLKLREEIRITRRSVIEQVPISGEIRREIVEIETESVAGERRHVELKPFASETV